MSSLVSMIVPCYNGGETIARCLESVLDQTYRSIELIVVNDGSTDCSEQIILSYQDRFQEAGMVLRYIYQENQGLGGAINTGLHYFTGDYLCWFDCDDFLFPESVKKRVEYLNTHPDIAIVTSDAYYYSWDDLETPIQKASDGHTDLYNPHQFENHLRSKAIFCAGCHMVRSVCFLKAVPDREIYPARRGQNWQMLLPIYYQFKQAFLNEPLYAYIQYPNSMSSGDSSAERQLKRYQEYNDIVMHTLDRIEMPARAHRTYKRIYSGIYARQKFYVGFSMHHYGLIIKSLWSMLWCGELKKTDISWILGVALQRCRKGSK